MKQWLRLFVLPACFLLLTLPVFSATYQDDFTDAASNSIKSYVNLKPFPMDAPACDPLPDRSAFTFASQTQLYGYALYKVRGAEQITVGLYTLSGAHVGQIPGTGGYALGHTGGPLTSGRQQARMSRDSGGVYASIGGALHRAYWSLPYYPFSPTDESPGELVGYGVNVYTTVDGASWAHIPLTQSAVSYRENNPFFYEQYSGSLPADCTVIRVELNDVPRFPSLDAPGSYQSKAPNTYNCLASVALSGESLTLGEPEPEAPEPYLPDGSSKERESARANAGALIIPESRAPAASSSQYSGSKFEGVIESSGGSTGRKTTVSSKSSQSAESGIPPIPDAEALEAEGPRYSDDTVYRIESRGDGDKPFTVGVTVYIIVVVVALTAVVIFSSVKKS